MRQLLSREFLLYRAMPANVTFPRREPQRPPLAALRRPFLIMPAVTGQIMLWSNVLEGRDGEDLYAGGKPATRRAAGLQPIGPCPAAVSCGISRRAMIPPAP